MKKYQDGDWLSQKYIEEQLSMLEIGKICGVGDMTIHRWLKIFNIPRRSRGEGIKLFWKNHPEAYRGKDSHAWKGGRRVDCDGYIFIYQPNHPHVNSGGCIYEHRLVMEKKIGRYLYPWERVHHINGIKDDNRIENLELLPSLGQHNSAVQEVYKENQFLREQLANFLSIRT